MKSLITTILFSLFLTPFVNAQHHSKDRSDEAYLGIYSNKVNDRKAKLLNFEKTDGLYITKVVPNTPAAASGLQAFDYVYQVDNYELKDFHNIGQVLKNYQPNEQAGLYIVRNGEEQRLAVNFGRRGDYPKQKQSNEEDPFLGISQSHDKQPKGVNGVIVNVSDNTTAEYMGLEDGDVITAINNYPTLDWHDLGAAIDLNKVGEPISIQLVRAGEEMTKTAPIASLADYHDSEYPYGVIEEQPAIAVIEDVQSTESDIEDVIIEMEDMPKEEAEEMKEELGIDMPLVQNLEIESLNIFPNPTEGMFNIRFMLPNTGATAIRVFNSNGQMIYANDLGNFSGDFNGRIDLTNNPAGTYFLMVQQKGYSISKKVVVVRN